MRLFSYLSVGVLVSVTVSVCVGLRVLNLSLCAWWLLCGFLYLLVRISGADEGIKISPGKSRRQIRVFVILRVFFCKKHTFLTSFFWRFDNNFNVGIWVTMWVKDNNRVLYKLMLSNVFLGIWHKTTTAIFIRRCKRLRRNYCYEWPLVVWVGLNFFATSENRILNRNKILWYTWVQQNTRTTDCNCTKCS